MSDNQVPVDFRIGCHSVVDINGRTKSSSSLRLDSESNIELNENPLILNTSYETKYSRVD